MDTKQAVDEMIADEQLTVEEIVDLLPDGWTLITEEYFSSLGEARKHSDEKVLELNRELAYRSQVMLDVCDMLSGCGSDDHKTKNETILRAINTLMQYRNPRTMFTRCMDNGDIPF